MAGNVFGKIFTLTTFGESHGAAIGGVLDGVPAGVSLDLDWIQSVVNQRKTGQNSFSSTRTEDDCVEWLSGMLLSENNERIATTLGTPVAFLVRNKDARSGDYDALKNIYRPSHADFTWDAKFGLRDHRGGGRSSARETVARVVAGAVARSVLPPSVEVTACVDSMGGISVPDHVLNQSAVFLKEATESSILRCPDTATSTAMEGLLGSVQAQGDTVGGTIYCCVDGVPAGWGEPVFDKLHAVLGHALLSINAVKGVEFGSGFSGSRLLGSQHNDAFIGLEKTLTNRSGGVQGGISNGAPLTMRIAFKPISSIQQEQKTIDRDGNHTTLSIGGRHDSTVLPRAVPIVEAMVAIVLADFYLLQKTNKSQ